MSASYAETAAEIAAVSNDVDVVSELIEESDRLLDVLETMNSAGQKEQTLASEFWTCQLGWRVLGVQLPFDHDVRRKVQAALDFVLDKVQPPLFLRHCRMLGLQYIGAADETDEEPES